MSSHPSLKKFSRSNRWNYLGLVNDPVSAKRRVRARIASAFGSTCAIPIVAADPFENEAKYPGVKIGARGRSDKFPAGSYYGYATGVVGLRLFPNPDFDEAAEKKWDPDPLL